MGSEVRAVIKNDPRVTGLYNQEKGGVCVCSVMSSSVTLWTVPTRLLCPWDFPGKNAGVGYHFLLRGSS